MNRLDAKCWRARRSLSHAGSVGTSGQARHSQLRAFCWGWQDVRHRRHWLVAPLQLVPKSGHHRLERIGRRMPELLGAGEGKHGQHASYGEAHRAAIIRYVANEDGPALKRRRSLARPFPGRARRHVEIEASRRKCHATRPDGEREAVIVRERQVTRRTGAITVRAWTSQTGRGHPGAGLGLPGGEGSETKRGSRGACHT